MPKPRHSTKQPTPILNSTPRKNNETSYLEHFLGNNPTNYGLNFNTYLKTPAGKDLLNFIQSEMALKEMQKEQHVLLAELDYLQASRLRGILLMHKEHDSNTIQLMRTIIEEQRARLLKLRTKNKTNQSSAEIMIYPYEETLKAYE